MSLWKRSVRQDDRTRGIFTKARNLSRKRRLHLENLEQRTLLSAYSISESYINGVPIVSETVNSTTTTYSNPTSPFVVNTGTGSNTVNILNTSAHVAITVNSSGSDTVNVGNGGDVQGILAAVTIQNPSGLDTVNVDDSADATARTARLSTYSSGGANWGSVTALAPAAINYKYSSTSSVNVTTGTAIDSVDVLTTGVTTNVSTSGGRDEVNVGNAGDVQGIHGALYIQNAQTYDTVNVYDSADATARTTTLNTYSSGGANWGSITGMAPAAINYKYGNTSSVNVATGTAANTVDVMATGVTTNIITGGSGADVINVGNAGSVQSILGRLYLQNSRRWDTVNVDDSADATARTATLNTYTSGAYNWGSITGLAPAAINYSYYSTASVNITTGLGADTVDALATGVVIDISNSGGLDTINVGNAGSVQGIQGDLNLQNSAGFDTIYVDDSADTTARITNLSTFSYGGSNWGSIDWLSPASIDYQYSHTISANITTGTGADTVDVMATGVTTNISSGGGDDSIYVGNLGSEQGILGILYLQNPSGLNTINITDYADVPGRTAALSTYSSGGYNWGSITGLAPASINYRYIDILSFNPINVSTAPGFVTWNVAANAMSGSIGRVVNDNGLPINSVPAAPTPNATYLPAPATASLFNFGGPSYLDVVQGNVGDCWLLASLAEVADRDPQIIQNMFTYDGAIVDNGSTVGLYTVRFFNTSGSPVSVQVDTELPAGGGYDAHVQNNLGTEALWVALAEKAYAVANGLGDVKTSHPNTSSYDALNNGWASWALQAITGLSASETPVNPIDVAAAWNAGDFIVMDTQLPSSSSIVASHAYALIDYHSNYSLPFELFNPWGTDSSGWAQPPGTTDRKLGLFAADATFISNNFVKQSIATGAIDTNDLTAPANKLTQSATLGVDYAASGAIDVTRHSPGGKTNAVTATAPGGGNTTPSQLTAIGVDALFTGDADGLGTMTSGHGGGRRGRKWWA